MSSQDHAEADRLLDEARHRLNAATADRDAPFRYPVLATADGSGGASARTLILRVFEPESWRVALHTDRRSAKLKELAVAHTATLVFYDHGAGLQVRLRGSAGVDESDDDRRMAWEALPESNRRNYRAENPPGTLLNAPGDGVADGGSGTGFENFALLVFTPGSIDILKLSADGNRRYRLDPESGSGSWLVP